MVSIMKIYAAAILLAWVVTGLFAFAYAGSYSWTDATGRRHTSDTPPPHLVPTDEKPPGQFPQGSDQPSKPEGILSGPATVTPDYRSLLKTVEKMEQQQAVQDRRPPPAVIHQTVPATKPARKPDRYRISEYKRRIVQLEKLIASRAELVAESARSVATLKAALIKLEEKGSPSTPEDKLRLENAHKAVRRAISQLAEDEMDLNGIRDNLETLKLELEAASR
jgi:hypothetical protein